MINSYLSRSWNNSIWCYTEQSSFYTTYSAQITGYLAGKPDLKWTWLPKCLVFSFSFSPALAIRWPAITFSGLMTTMKILYYSTAHNTLQWGNVRIFIFLTRHPFRIELANHMWPDSQMFWLWLIVVTGLAFKEVWKIRKLLALPQCILMFIWHIYLHVVNVLVSSWEDYT